jgi:hypothetical protein
MRDFRDAKAMAHALRQALKSRAVETTHSESLELIAKAFGYDNWNILSAKIEAAVPLVQEERPPLSTDSAPASKTLYCSFCGKSQHEVRKLIAGPTVFICDECAELCTDILREEEPIWNVMSLLNAGKEGGDDGYLSALKRARDQSTDKISYYVEQCRHGAEHNRRLLHHIDRLLEMPNDEASADDVSRFAYLNEKTADELRALREDAQRTLTRFEAAVRIGTTVLGERHAERAPGIANANREE